MSFDKYPYSDFHELNLDWVIKTMKENVAAIQATLTSVQEALAEVTTYNARITYVEGKITELLNETSDLDLKIRRVETTLGEKIDDAQLDINRLKPEVEQLVREMETITLEVRSLTSNMTNVQGRLASVEASIQSINGAIESINRALDDIDRTVTYTNHLILVGNHIENAYHEIVTFETIKALFLNYKDRTILTRDGDDAIYVANATDGDAVWFSLFYEEGGKIYCERVIINSDEQINEHSIELAQNDIVIYHPGDIPEHTYLIYKGVRISESDAYSVFLSNPFAIIYDEVNADYYQLINRDSILTFNNVKQNAILFIELSRSGIQSYSVPIGGGGDVTDVQINGTSIIDEDGVANIPYTAVNVAGVVRIQNSYGIGVYEEGRIGLSQTSPSEISARVSLKAITPRNLDFAIKSAMCDGVGEAWTETEKAAARERMGITSGGISYSTDSHVIGKWIDGRDLYEKTFTWEGDYGEGSAQTLINEPNLDYIVDIRGACRERGDTGNFWPVPWGGTQSWGVNANVTSGTPEQRAVRVVFNGDWGGSRGISKVHVSIQFVKTAT